MLNNINLNLLKYFYEVINTKNITKASENLYVSQPAISRAIKELEQQLNTKLLIRNKLGVTPTKEGQILYEHLLTIFKDFNSTLNIIENQKEKRESLYIGATTTNFLEPIKTSLKELKEKYPNIHIDITLDEINILNDKAKLNKLDIIIKNDYENIENFTNIKSFDITDKFVASSKHYNHLSNQVLTLDQLLEYPLVLLSEVTHGRKNFDNFLNKNNKQVKPTYEFNSYSLCKELIKNGFGIGIGNPIHYQNKDFIILNTNFNLPKRTFNIGYIKTSKNPLINKFIDFLINKK